MLVNVFTNCNIITPIYILGFLNNWEKAMTKNQRYLNYFFKYFSLTQSFFNNQKHSGKPIRITLHSHMPSVWRLLGKPKGSYCGHWKELKKLITVKWICLLGMLWGWGKMFVSKRTTGIIKLLYIPLWAEY